MLPKPLFLSLHVESWGATSRVLQNDLNQLNHMHVSAQTAINRLREDGIPAHVRVCSQPGAVHCLQKWYHYPFLATDERSGSHVTVMRVWRQSSTWPAGRQVRDDLVRHILRGLQRCMLDRDTPDFCGVSGLCTNDWILVCMCVYVGTCVRVCMGARVCS